MFAVNNVLCQKKNTKKNQQNGKKTISNWKQHNCLYGDLFCWYHRISQLKRYYMVSSDLLPLNLFENRFFFPRFKLNPLAHILDTIVYLEWSQRRSHLRFDIMTLRLIFKGILIARGQVPFVYKLLCFWIIVSCYCTRCFTFKWSWTIFSPNFNEKTRKYND